MIPLPRHSHLLILVIIPALCLARQAFADQTGQSYRDYRQEAFKAESNGDYQNARQLLKQACETDDSPSPCKAEYLALLDRISLKLHRQFGSDQDRLEAIEILDEALTIDPTWAWGHYRNSRLQRALKNEEAAIVALDRAIEEAPQTSRFLKRRAYLHKFADRHEAAAADAFTALETGAKNPFLRKLLAKSLLEIHDEQKAIEEVMIWRDSEIAAWEIGQRALVAILIETERHEIAKSEIESIINRRLDEAHDWENLANVRKALLDHEPMKNCDQLMKRFGENLSHRFREECLAWMNTTPLRQSAETWLETELASTRKNSANFRWMSGHLLSLYRKNEQQSQQLELLNHLIKNQPFSTSNLTTRARLLADQGFHERALEDWEAISYRSPSTYQEGKFRLLEKMGRLDQALKELDEAIEFAESDKNLGKALANMARHLVRTGDHEAALDYWRQAESADPGNTSYLSGKFRALLELGKLLEIQRLLNKESSSNLASDQHKQLMRLAAKALQRSGNFQAALPYWQKLLDDDPTDIDTLRSVLQCLQSTDQHEAAEKRLLQEFDSMPDRSRLDQLAKLLHGLYTANRKPNSRSTRIGLHKLQSKYFDSNSPNLIHALAAGWIREEIFVEATHTLRRLIQMKQATPETYRLLAKALDQNGDTGPAIDASWKAIALASSTTLDYGQERSSWRKYLEMLEKRYGKAVRLPVLLAHRNRFLSASVADNLIWETIRNAKRDDPSVDRYLANMVERSPNNIRYRELLAARYIKSRNFEKAATEYKRLLELQPKNFASFHGLAQAQEKLGRHEESIATLKAAEAATSGELTLQLKTISQAFKRLEAHDEASKYFEASLNLHSAKSDMAIVQLAHAKYLDEINEPQAALDEINQGLMFDPNNTAAWQLKLNLHKQLEDIESGIQDLSVRLGELGTGLHTYRLLLALRAKYYGHANQTKAAINDWNVLIGKYPQVTSYRLSRAEMLIRQTDFNRAEADFLHVLRSGRPIGNRWVSLLREQATEDEVIQFIKTLLTSASELDDSNKTLLGRTLLESLAKRHGQIEATNKLLSIIENPPPFLYSRALKMRAEGYEAEGLFNSAIDDLNEIISLAEPGKANFAWRKLFKLYIKLELDDDALSLIDNYKGSNKAKNNLFWELYREAIPDRHNRERTLRQIRYLKASLELKPTELKPHIRIGGAYEHLNDFEKAFTHYCNYVQHDSSYWYIIVRAVDQTKLEPTCMDLLDQQILAAVQQPLLQANLLNNRGTIGMHLRETQDAIRDFTEAISLKFNDENLRKNLFTQRAAASLEANQPEIAFKDFENALLISNNHYAGWRGLEKALEAMSDSNTKITSLDNLDKNLLVLERGRSLKLETLERLEMYNEALEILDQNIQQASDISATLLNKRADLLEKIGDINRATHEWRKIVDLAKNTSLTINPKNPGRNCWARKLIDRAKFHRRQKQFELAIIDWNHCIQLAPNYFEAYIAKFWIFMDSERYSDALRTLESIPAELASNHSTRVQTAYADYYFFTRSFGNVINEIDGVITNPTKNEELVNADVRKAEIVSAHVRKGLALIALDQYPEALESFLIANHHSSESSAIHFNLGYVHFMMGNSHEAIIAYARGLQYEDDLLGLLTQNDWTLFLPNFLTPE